MEKALKKFGIAMLLLIWLFLTLLACLSIVGLVLVIGDGGPTTWQDIALKLTNKLTE